MNSTRALALLFTLMLPVASLAAATSSATFSYSADPATLAAVTAADDERVAAMIAKDRERMHVVYSDELHYAHSNGTIDDKTAYLDSIVNGRSVYEGWEYKTREFRPIAPGVMLMTGRALIQSRNSSGPNLLDLNFLAVWRLEDGRWRFLAWQSCRNPPPAP